MQGAGVVYLIGTSAFNVESNPVPEKLSTGGYVPLNFHLPPFNFRRGILEWMETIPSEDVGTTMMSIWEIKDINPQNFVSQ